MKYFLGNTEKEAQETYNSFIKHINYISREFSIRTGEDKKDLFNEAFIALHNAKSNYKENPDCSFYSYARKAIYNHLSDFIKEKKIIHIPRYMNRAISIVYKIEKILEENGFIEGIEAYLSAQENQEKIDISSVETINLTLEKLYKIATRANTTPEKIIKRIKFIPQIEYTEKEQSDSVLDIREDFMKSFVSFLEEDEKRVVSCIVDGYSIKQIADKIRKSESEINNIIKSIKKKYIKIRGFTPQTSNIQPKA